MTPTPALPSRPWTRDDVPLVWRDDRTIEIGYPPRTVIVQGVERDEVAWLVSLRGDRTLTEALASGQAKGVTPGAMRRLLVTGVRTGLVDDSAQIPETLREALPHVRDHLAGDVAVARHLHGGTPRAREVIDRRRRAEVAVQGDGILADVICLALTTGGIANVVRAGSAHSSSRRHRRAALERTCQVICDNAHPDSASDPESMALDIPHLAVSALGTQAVIGPLVIPGRTSCLRCRDLHRADADPDWPRLAAQWAHRRTHRPAVASALAHLAAAWAALQVLALVDAGPEGADVPTMAGAIVVTLPDARVHHETRPPHPLCGCTWPHTGTGRGTQPSMSARC